MTPKNKAESTDLFARGCYGNNIQQWDSPCVAMLQSSGPFVIRYKGEPGVQGPAVFGIHEDKLFHEWCQLIKIGWEAERLYVNASIPPERIVFQGELSTGNWADPEWYLCGNIDSGIHMREAMKKPNLVLNGWRAREYLRKHMDWSSWEDLNLLIDTYPDAVIELVIFDTPHGRLDYTGRRAIVWECRAF